MDGHRRRVKPINQSRAREMRREPALAEKLLWSKLRDRQLNGFKFRRQFPIETFVLDFFCAECNLAVELDGDPHSDRKDYDEQRSSKLKSLGIDLLRFPNTEVFDYLDDVLEEILRVGELRMSRTVRPSPQPSPLSTGERG